MAYIILKDVTYVHAAAQDCKPGAATPAMYMIGDTVRVECTDGTKLDVELSQYEVATGNFQGNVKASTTEGVEPGDDVSFHFI